MPIEPSQRYYRAPCPGCGAPVEFRSAQSTHAVCAYCQSTVVRQGETLARIGKMAELFDDFSPLQLFAAGRIDGKAFTLVGRLQYGYEGGRWTEWIAAFDGERTGVLSEDNGALDDILEFTDISRPVVVHQHLQCFGAEPVRRLHVFFAIFVREELDKPRNIFSSLAQRRELNVDDIEPVIQIFSEFAFVDQLFQVHIGRRNNTSIDFDGIDASEAHEFLFLNDAQKLRLCFKADRSNFVEEDRPLIGDLEQTAL